MSTIPGITHCPATSTTSGQPVSSSGVTETAATAPSTIPRWRTPYGPPVPSKNRPPLMIVSKVTAAIEPMDLTRVKYRCRPVSRPGRREPLVGTRRPVDEVGQYASDRRHELEPVARE